MTVSKETAIWAYQKMHEIRNFENEIHRVFMLGEIPGFVHLSAGQEASATGVCAHLTETDYLIPTHRGHGHCIAKGSDINLMMAEIFGKETGLCKGKGGSMHIADFDNRILGANGIIGGNFPLAVGAGIRSHYLKTNDVVVCFFGDGAANEGAFHESMNMAAIWNLPIVFVCENNLFGEATPHKYASASKTIAERSVAYNIPGVHVDGKDFAAVYDAAGEAIQRAKKGEGPSIVECLTYRNYGHYVGDEQTYKTRTGKEKELADRDCIQELKAVLLKNKWLSEAEAKVIEEQAVATIDAALKFAQESPIPRPEALYEDVFK